VPNAIIEAFETIELVYPIWADVGVYAVVGKVIGPLVVIPDDAVNVPFIVVAVDAVPTVIIAPDISDAPIIISPVV
jgi:hypothetical protein